MLLCGPGNDIVSIVVSRGEQIGVFIDCLSCAVQLKWASETCTQLSSDELAKDVLGAEEMINRHQEVKAEIDGREEK